MRPTAARSATDSRCCTSSVRCASRAARARGLTASGGDSPAAGRPATRRAWSLEADRLGCVREVIVIAAALSIQDPRERPADQREAADAQHRRFADRGSDFLAWLALWRHVREQQRALSASAFRRRCRAEFLHALRIREWQDLVEQLRDAARSAGLTLNEQPAAADRIHRAVLSGLLSHIGRRAANGREYEGARGLRFSPAPDSALSAARPAWAMVAELVHTSRLWGRHGAAIQPAWAQALAGHLVAREHDAPVWERSRPPSWRESVSRCTGSRSPSAASPMTASITAGRGSCSCATRSCRASGTPTTRSWPTTAGWSRRSARSRSARAAGTSSSTTTRCCASTTSASLPRSRRGAQFERWWHAEAARHPRAAALHRASCCSRAGAAAPSERDLPRTWVQDGLELELSYRFEPGHEQDGVTVHVPLTRLHGVTAAGFEWLVPGLRAELLTALIRTLPKELRRPLVPVPALVDRAARPPGAGARAPAERARPRDRAAARRVGAARRLGPGPPACAPACRLRGRGRARRPARPRR